jgi:hypothetical protein
MVCYSACVCINNYDSMASGAMIRDILIFNGSISQSCFVCGD